MGIGKIQSGSIARRQNVVTLTKDGGQVPGKISDLAVFSGLERTDVETADAGEIVALSGLEEVNIGDTIADPANPVALPARDDRRTDRPNDFFGEQQPVRRSRREIPHLTPPS